MGLPTDDDNWEGYNASQVVTRVDNFRNKDFLLVHGNADDNVHYQQSMLLARALEKADIMFEQLVNPSILWRTLCSNFKLVFRVIPTKLMASVELGRICTIH